MCHFAPALRELGLSVKADSVIMGNGTDPAPPKPGKAERAVHRSRIDKTSERVVLERRGTHGAAKLCGLFPMLNPSVSMRNRRAPNYPKFIPRASNRIRLKYSAIAGVSGSMR